MHTVMFYVILNKCKHCSLSGPGQRLYKLSHAYCYNDERHFASRTFDLHDSLSLSLPCCSEFMQADIACTKAIDVFMRAVNAFMQAANAFMQPVNGKLC